MVCCALSLFVVASIPNCHYNGRDTVVSFKTVSAIKWENEKFKRGCNYYTSSCVKNTSSVLRIKRVGYSQESAHDK